MNVIAIQRDLVRQMLEDEAWYEGERRREYVSVHDFMVVTRVLAILEKDGGLILDHARRLAS